MADQSLKIGIVMDPIGSITPYKDSSFAMLLEAERRNAEIHYLEQKDVRLLSGKALGQSTLLHVRDDNDDWFEFGEQQEIELGDLDAILMRKDPPFDMEYVYTTYILDRAQQAGCTDRQCAAGIARHERESLHSVVPGMHADNADHAFDGRDESVPR